MTKSRSFSIYLPKEGFDATNSLKEDHALEGGTNATQLPTDATLFVLDNPPREPWWKGYFGVTKTLRQVTKGALIFLPAGGRCFALSFGHVSHNLRETSYEYDFGLRVTLNSLDPTKLKSTDVLEPGAARRQRTQVPVDSDLTYFDFDRDSAILKTLTGKVKAEHAELFKHATGASNLRISSAVEPTGLVGLCEKLLVLYKSEAFKITFPDIQNITPVRDPVVVDQLNENLIAAFRKKSDDVYLTVPDIVDYHANVFASFSGAGASLIYDDVFIGLYYEYLEQKKFAVVGAEIDDLKQHSLRLTDEDGNPRERYSIFNCLLYDTSLNGGTETYHLTEGNWYRVENDYIAKLKTFLDPLCKNFSLPAYAHNSEGHYNKAVAAGDPAILCLDITNISAIGQTPIEPCDLYTVNNAHAVFNHIKISTLSAQLSHLFNQGTNAIELLKLDTDAANRLKALIAEKASPHAAVGLVRPIDEQKYHVVFGIVTHKDKNRKSDNLPLFSRISLMRNMKTLQLMSVKASYGFIEDRALKTAGKKKKRKQKDKDNGTAEAAAA